MKNTALITGASSGIGYELAKIHASENGDLVLVARSENKLLALKEEILKINPVKVEIIVKDLSKDNAAQEVYDILKEKSIDVNYLVNNAGFGDYGFFHETNWEKEAQMIDLNMKALTHFTKLFVKDMINRGEGKILNVASTAAFQPGPLMAIYYATKHYVLAFSEAIANELKGTGVTVSTLCPGPTESGFVDAASLSESKLFQRMTLATSKEVAEYGYKKMLKGKTVAIHGVMNRIMANSSRFVPRNLITGIVRKMQERA